MTRDMEIAARDGTSALVPQLRNWLVPIRRIGSATYQGECVIACARHVSYQQQSTTFGSSSGVFGLTGNGNGFVTGGGGFVDTVHRGVVSVVLEDDGGRHVTEELPSGVAIMNGGVVRLDRINGRLIAVTNMTGRQDAHVLLGPSAFIGSLTLTKRHGVLMLAALMMAGQAFSPHPFAGIAMTGALAALPILRLRKMHALKRDRQKFKNYMLEVMS